MTNKTQLKPQKDNLCSATRLMKALEAGQKLTDIPPAYTFVQVDFLKQQLAWLFRYEKAYTRMFNLRTEEHYSFIVDAQTYKLKNITYRGEELANQKLLSKKEAYQTAISFLDKMNLEPKKELKFIGIETDYQTISSSSHIFPNSLEIAGIKVKFKHKKSQTYTWLTLGHQGQIIDLVTNVK